MRILLISEFFPTSGNLRYSGGVEARNYFLAKYLGKKHKIHVITSLLPQTKKLEKINGASIYRVGPRRDYSASAGSLSARIKFILSSVKSARKLKVDIVDGSNFLTHPIAKIIATGQKIPAVAWYPDVWIGSWLRIAGMGGLVGEIIERANIKLRFDAYIAISETKARQLRRLVRGKVSVIGCGVDKNELRITAGKASSPTILCAARLVAYKRVADLVWAFAIVAKKIPALKLIIVGRGPEKRKLTGIIKMLKLSRVSFLDNLKRADFLKLLKSAHLFCLPSTVEGFGITVVESAAAGVPYVISDIPVFREITKNGRGGLFFKPMDIKDLSVKLEKLLKNKKLYLQKVKECTSLAQNYDWQQVAQKTEDLYQSLIKKYQR